MPFPLGISASQLKTPPLPPEVVSQSDSGSNRDFDNGASFLTFQDTPYTGKLPIVDYTVTAVSTDGLDTVEQTVNALTPFVLTGLKSGRQYKFKVRARNIVFNSAFSPEFGPGTITTVPGRTTSAAVTNLANGGGASISWIAPSNGGKTITSYLITPNIGAPVETNSSSTTYTFSGLTVGTGYNFTVAARNENGLGQASTTTNLVTITAPAPPPPPPPPPTEVLPTVPAFSSFTTSYTGSYNSYTGTASFTGNGFTNSYSWQSSDGRTGFGNGNSASISSGTVACNNAVTFVVFLYSGSNQTGVSAFDSRNAVTPACPSGPPSQGTVYTGTWGPCVYDATKSGQTTTYNCVGCSQYYETTASGTSTCSNNNCDPAAQPSCPPLIKSSGLISSNSTACCPVSPTTTSYTYCPSLGYSVLSSGYPCNCPGAGGCVTSPPPPPATSCAGPCFGSWLVIGGVCQCVTATNPPPTVIVPPPTPPPPPPPSSSCACRDFRGRCLSASRCFSEI